MEFSLKVLKNLPSSFPIQKSHKHAERALLELQCMGTVKTKWTYSHGRRFNASCTHLKSDSAESYKI